MVSRGAAIWGATLIAIGLALTFGYWQGTASAQDKNSLIFRLERLEKYAEVPVGSVIAFAGAGKIPDGWLPCDGKGYPTKGDYSELFATIGYNYQAKKSGPTFLIPNYRGYFLRGASPKIAVGTPQEDRVKQHRHILTATPHDHGSHKHKVPRFALVKLPLKHGGDVNVYTDPIDHRGTHTDPQELVPPENPATGVRTVTVNINGTPYHQDLGPENHPKNVSVIWIIKAKRHLN